MQLIHGDALETLRTLPDASVDAVVTDPPYELGFMGKGWDRSGVAFRPETWTAVLRVLRPGAYLLAFGGTRTYHRLTCAIEDAGFAVRDCLMWLYGQGMPKGKGCLKPAWEPIVLARKPGGKVRPLGIDGCRVPTDDDTGRTRNTALGRMNDDSWQPQHQESESHPAGRWPANVLHDGSGEVLEAFAAFGDKSTRDGAANNRKGDKAGYMKGWGGEEASHTVYGDVGAAARFFYCAKASKSERGAGNTHATVKPLALMQWLVRLVTPPGGVALDPFMGSGTTGVAAVREWRDFVGVDDHEAHVEIARRRIAEAEGCRDGRGVGELFAHL